MMNERKRLKLLGLPPKKVDVFLPSKIHGESDFWDLYASMKYYHTNMGVFSKHEFQMHYEGACDLIGLSRDGMNIEMKAR